MVTLYSLRKKAGKPVIVCEKKIEKVVKCGNPESVRDFVNEEFLLSERIEEYTYLLCCLNGNNNVNGVFEIAHGGYDFAHCDPKSVFIRALLCGSSKIILVHNHPSGDPTPSDDDYNITKKLYDGGKLLSINLLDHVIVGDGMTYYSMHDNNFFAD